MNERERLAQTLREACADIRRRPYPIADLIPLIQRAADLLDGKQEPKPGALVLDKDFFKRN